MAKKTMSIDLYGSEDLLEKFARMGRDSTAVVGRVLYNYANDVFNRSQYLVPVDTGALRSSGRVEAPVLEGFAVVVSIKYGGAAAPYALWVHEVPPPEEAASGERTAYHLPPTQWKYLEQPLLDTIEDFKVEFRKTVERLVEGRTS
jgi:hypothetical protein